MRDVNYGWLLRNMHAAGASMFFFAVYIHMFRGLYYGSYKEPREVLWILGVIIYLLMMATGFMGYVLPWGQMSFWGATVITNLFSAIPYVGESIVTLLWGGYLRRQSDAEPLLLAALSAAVRDRWRGGAARLGAACRGPEQSDRRRGEDRKGHGAVHAIRDDQGHVRRLVLPDLLRLVHLLHAELSRRRRQLHSGQSGRDPAHIVPEWYYLPFYAILRSIPNKLAGVIAMFSAIIVLVFLPWLDSAKTRSSKYRPLAKQFFWIFVIVCVLLGYLGAQPPEGIYVIAGRILTVCYFAYFLSCCRCLSRIEKPRPVPNSIADDVLAKHGGQGRADGLDGDRARGRRRACSSAARKARAPRSRRRRRP